MPSYRVRVQGNGFSAEDEGAIYPDRQAAGKAAMRAAIQIAADEAVRRGTSASLQASVELEGRVVARYSVALTTAEAVND